MDPTNPFEPRSLLAITFSLSPSLSKFDLSKRFVIQSDSKHTDIGNPIFSRIVKGKSLGETIVRFLRISLILELDVIYSKDYSPVKGRLENDSSLFCSRSSSFFPPSLILEEIYDIIERDGGEFRHKFVEKFNKVLVRIGSGDYWIIGSRNP